MTNAISKTRRRLLPPRGLSTEARQLWFRIVDEYVLDDGASQTLLGELCFALDGLRRCQKEIAADGMIVEGSRGQRRAHPLLTVENEYRRQLLAAVRALRLDIAMD